MADAGRIASDQHVSAPPALVETGLGCLGLVPALSGEAFDLDRARRKDVRGGTPARLLRPRAPYPRWFGGLTHVPAKHALGLDPRVESRSPGRTFVRRQGHASTLESMAFHVLTTTRG